MVSKELFKQWCESGFKEFAGDRRTALKYGLSVGLLEYDVSVIRKIAGLSSAHIKPFKTTPEERRLIVEEHKQGCTIRTIAKRHNLSPSIVHRYVHRGESL